MTRFNAPLRRHPLALALIAAFAAGSVHAQSTPTAPVNPSKAKQLQTVVVTGTRAFDRTEADSLSPIDVLTPKDLTATGATSLASALRTLLPSFNFPQPSVTDGTDAIQPAQLRGLSPDETLVLINGKRQHTTAIVNVNGTLGRGSSPVDLNAIPINAIARIEVLRDGAAAQYGSDAIAGVINIILKGGNQGGSVSATVGRYNSHDGADGMTVQGGADGGFALGDKGWVHLSVDATHQDPTNLAGPDLRYPTDPTYGQVTFHYGLPLLKQQNAALNMQYDFAPQVQFYAFALVNKRDVSSPGFFRSLSAYKTSSPAALAVYPAGYLPVENSAIWDGSLVAGLRGTVLDGWHYDVSANTGGNHWKLDTSNTFNYSLGSASPTAFYIGTITNQQNVLNADFSKDVNVSALQNPLTVAWGLEYRQEKFAIKQGDAASYAGAGAQVFPGYQPLDAGSHSRHNQAVYLDLENDLTDKLSAGFAVRHEKYSDFGSTTSWKLSGRYAFNDTIAARATASTGFRAPSLQQEFYSSTAINFVNVGGGNLVPYTIRTFPVDNPAAVALGAQPLQPEKSHNYSVGLVFTPQNGLYATLDFYQITIDNRVILSGNLVGTAVQNYLTSIGIPQVSGGRFFTNAVNTRTRGVDLVGTYPIDLGAAGSLKLTGGGNYNKTDILYIRPNPPQLGLAGLTLPVIDRPTQGLITTGSPRDKLFLAGDWSYGNWRVHGQATRWGSFATYGSTPSGDLNYGAKVTLDASVGYVWNRWNFTVGGDNLTNQYPTRVPATSAFNIILPYSQNSPFGFSGAYYYATVAYHW
ncbi:MAG: TonB-dependent receptor [Xanthomonadaceae bacterium]|nr:TonB-dependent receptor [Xanthomonadaceae bacterium]MDE2177454.1 TonB-dependent receptor [Xanthomonadaceae bacterium]